jgi:hypothetical protein
MLAIINVDGVDIFKGFLEKLSNLASESSFPMFFSLWFVLSKNKEFCNLPYN